MLVTDCTRYNDATVAAHAAHDACGVRERVTVRTHPTMSPFDVMGVQISSVPIDLVSACPMSTNLVGIDILTVTYEFVTC